MTVEFTRLVRSDSYQAHKKLFTYLKRNGFNKGKTAESMGVSLTTLENWLKKLNAKYLRDPDVRKQSKRLAETRVLAKREATVSIRLIEKWTVDNLEGERFRGLPNLAPKDSAPFFGMRIRGKSDEKLPAGRPVLIMDEMGMLMMATLGDGVTTSEVATDEDLRAEDVISVARKIGVAMGKHEELCITASAKFEECRRVAEAIAKILPKDKN